MDVSTAVKEIIRQVVEKEFDDEQVLLMTHLVDSIDVIAIAVAIEKKFGISIDGEEINFDNFDTVKRMGEFVSRKISEREGK